MMKRARLRLSMIYQSVMTLARFRSVLQARVDRQTGVCELRGGLLPRLHAPPEMLAAGFADVTLKFQLIVSNAVCRLRRS